MLPPDNQAKAPQIQKAKGSRLRTRQPTRKLARSSYTNHLPQVSWQPTVHKCRKADPRWHPLYRKRLQRTAQRWNVHARKKIPSVLQQKGSAEIHLQLRQVGRYQPTTAQATACPLAPYIPTASKTPRPQRRTRKKQRRRILKCPPIILYLKWQTPVKLMQLLTFQNI